MTVIVADKCPVRISESDGSKCSKRSIAVLRSQTQNTYIYIQMFEQFAGDTCDQLCKYFSSAKGGRYQEFFKLSNYICLKGCSDYSSKFVEKTLGVEWEVIRKVCVIVT